MMSACNSQVASQASHNATAIDPVPILVTQAQTQSLADFSGSRFTETPSPTATSTPIPSATTFTGLIPTLANPSATASITASPNSSVTASPTNEPVTLFINDNSVQHTVIAGETLNIIANNYGVTVNQLLTSNNMRRDQILLVGQVLTIPLPTETPIPTATVDTNNNVAVAINEIILSAPTPFPSIVNNLRYDEFFLMDDAVIANIRDIYANGLVLGRDPHAFTRIGDSTIEAPHFLYRFDSEDFHLGDFAYLQRTIDYYAGSFDHDSVAVIRGLHTWSVFDPMWSPSSCEVGEHMLACEFRLHNPSVIIIRIGTNNRGSADLTREDFQAIVSYCIDNGVIPILGTKADRFDGEANSVNTIIRNVAEEYNVPLWDFDLLASTLPGHGLTTDNVHLSAFYAHDWRLARGFTTGHGLHNLTALIVLDEVLQVLNDA